MIYLYFIVGIIMCVAVNVCVIIDEQNKAKTYFKDPTYWIIQIVCAIIWPVILIKAINNMYQNK
jgi:hypothetical protein